VHFEKNIFSSTLYIQRFSLHTTTPVLYLIVNFEVVGLDPVVNVMILKMFSQKNRENGLFGL
jgi:hypothetical protein